MGAKIGYLLGGSTLGVVLLPNRFSGPAPTLSNRITKKQKFNSVCLDFFNKSFVAFQPGLVARFGKGGCINFISRRKCRRNRHSERRDGRETFDKSAFHADHPTEQVDLSKPEELCDLA